MIVTIPAAALGQELAVALGGEQLGTGEEDVLAEVTEALISGSLTFAQQKSFPFMHT